MFNKYQSYTTAIYDKQVIIYPDHGPWLCKVSKGKFLINLWWPQETSMERR